MQTSDIFYLEKDHPENWIQPSFPILTTSGTQRRPFPAPPEYSKPSQLQSSKGQNFAGLPGMPLLPLCETTCQRETPLNARLPGSSVEVQVRLDGSICVVTWLWNMVARCLPFLPYCNVDTISCLLQYLEKNSLGQMNSKASLVVFYLSVHSSAFCRLLLIHQKEWESCFHCWCPNQMSKM